MNAKPQTLAERVRFNFLIPSELDREALALYDQGIPNSIHDPYLRDLLNGHRWGWHSPDHKSRSQSVPACPACMREASK